MNINKIIFAILWIIFLVWIIIVILNLNDNNNNVNNNSTKWVFKIWIVWDDVEPLKNTVDKFKSLHKEYSSLEILIESFSSYEEYYYSLVTSITSWKSPDLFVLNNNEKNSVFSNQTIVIDPLTISINDFRKKFKWFFSDDLIVTLWDSNVKKEYLLWIPVWYETLGVFYNRRYVKNTDLSSISTLNNVISNLKNTKPEIVPIWIWNGSTVYGVSDIITQFFMLESWVSWLNDLDSNKMKEWFSSYMTYWDLEWYNGYNSKYEELNSSWLNSLDLFSKWDTHMVVWYPRIIKQIKEKWFWKNFLLATPFPHYYSWEWKTLVNYNYFVINKDSTNKQLANSFLSYLSSDIWALEYLKSYKYYLPALLSLESDKLEEKIHEDYNLVLWDFYSADYDFGSFDKWIKNIYDKWIIPILDNTSNYESIFEKLKASILCESKKISTLENLSNDCKL